MPAVLGITDAFLTAPNLLNIVRQSAPLLIVAAAMTFVITTGGIDLSVGSVLALVATLSAVTLQAGLPWPLVIIAMLLLGAAVGAIQGFFIAYERIPAFIVTLAGLSVIRGIALLITGGYSIPVEATSPFTVIGRAWFLGVPVPALIALVVLVVAYLVFNETRFGRYVTGIGANAEAVRRAGVDTRLTTLMVYVLSSTAAAAAGIILAARLGSGSSNAGQGFELEVIAAVVLGGTSLFGGRGTLDRHRTRRHDRRRHRQRPDPCAYVTIPYAHRHRHDHSRRDLAELPAVSRRDPEQMNDGSRLSRPMNAARAPIGVKSGTVMTVQGPLPVGEMGVTLMHEHILLDGATTWKCPCHPGRTGHRRSAGIDRDHRRIAHEPLHQP